MKSVDTISGSPGISGSVFQKPLQAALEHALAHLDNLDRSSVGTQVALPTLRARLNRPLGDEGIPGEQVIHDLAADVEDGIIGSAGGRFFAWVIGGSVPSALAADWLTAAWDQNAGHHACAPAAAVAEEIAGEWLKEVLGLPARASFALVTGCQMAHVTCLAAARQSLLATRGWDVEKQGLYGAPPIRIFCSESRHETFDRAVRLLGLGLAQVTHLGSDSQGRIDAAVLENALASQGSNPAIILLEAGELNTGAYDSFETLIPIAKRFNAWVHLDGAFGLWAGASPRYRHLLRGAEQADSWATDGHKWLNVPYDCGYAFVADAEAHRSAMTYQAAYLLEGEAVRDPLDWTPEWSRRARAFPTYAALRQLGRKGVAEIIERCCRHAHTLVTMIGGLPGAEVVAEPVINQGLVRFLDAKRGACDADHDRRTDQVIAAIVAGGEAYFGGTTVRGRRVMRVSVCNWQTSDEDVARVVQAVRRILAGNP
jgi:glutamate/tyrosine decarboxylase-like PLP-dependent enzyme